MTVKRKSIFDLIETDKAAEEEGRWFNDIFATRDEDHPEISPGVDVKLRRLSSAASMRVRQSVEREYRTGLSRTQALPQDVLTKILVEQMARAVIIDWRGVVDNDGNDIPFTVEAARDLLTRLHNMRDIILTFSHDLENFRAEKRTEVVGNSQT